MTKEKEQKLRDKIIEAVPSINKGYRITEILGKSNHNQEWAKVKLGRPIKLTDVLLAIGKKSEETSLDTEGIHPLIWKTKKWEWICANWNLLKDYDDQSEETKTFLYDLLK